MHLARFRLIQEHMSSRFQKLTFSAFTFLLATAMLYGQEPPRPSIPSRITLHLTDVDVRIFLRFIHSVARLNIVIAPDVSGRVTAMLNDVPWDQALDSVFRANGLVGEREGNILRVMTEVGATREREMRRHAAAAAEAAVPEETCTYRLENASAADVARVVSSFLSPRGRIVADERTNMVIVRDVPAVLQSLGFSAVPASKGRCFRAGQ